MTMHCLSGCVDALSKRKGTCLFPDPGCMHPHQLLHGVWSHAEGVFNAVTYHVTVVHGTM